MRQRPKLVYLGDDFTGSTDPLNVLGSRGVPCVLFIGRLEPEVIDSFEFLSPHFKGKPLETFGLAGVSRSLPAADMDAYLTPRFEAARRFEPEFFHYKVCSTFDSSPAIGNIGTAIETGRKVFGDVPCPVLVASEHLKRYVAFSHLFAGDRGEVFAINSHPVMSCHPITPMPDSDLRIHLAKQTTASIGYVHSPDLDATVPEKKTKARKAKKDARRDDFALAIFSSMVAGLDPKMLLATPPEQNVYFLGAVMCADKLIEALDKK